jgi:hypothetical protein
MYRCLYAYQRIKALAQVKPLPKAATFIYLLAGSNQSLKFEFIQQFLMQNFVTLQKKLVMLSPIPLGEPKTSATLYMPDEIIISLLAN